MIQCSECEHFVAGPDGQHRFRCNPFTNIKEPECLQKWQLIKLDLMVRAYQATAEAHRKLEPLQDKMIRYMEREMNDVDEADAWKYNPDDDLEEEEEDPDTLR